MSERLLSDRAADEPRRDPDLTDLNRCLLEILGLSA